MVLEVGDEGQVYVQSQVTDYKEENIATEEAGRRRRQQRNRQNDDDSSSQGISNNEEMDAGDNGHRRGRPPHLRGRYLDGHPSARKKQRVSRAHNHRNPFYCATMLTLLKPWRNLSTARDGERLRRVLGGIQYFHDCSAAARDHVDDDDLPEDDFDNSRRGAQDAEEGEMPAMIQGEGLSEEGLQALIEAGQGGTRERLHALHGLEAARQASVFTDEVVPGNGSWVVSNATPPPANANEETMRRIAEWTKSLEADVRRQNAVQSGEAGPGALEADGSGVERMEESDVEGDDEGVQGIPNVTPLPAEEALSAANAADLGW